MGWNSYDTFDTTVTEKDVLEAARVLQTLKPHGWEYVVVDIQWYAPDTGTRRDEYQYIPFSFLHMDEYSRLLPDKKRFPSARGGIGFKPLADQIHAMGLKFGIHIMRGIPREAAHRHMKLLGTDLGAHDAAEACSICNWNSDMYGVNNNEAGQKYYDSIIELYASWGVDFIKCDDICTTQEYPHNLYSAAHEIEMLYKAIEKVDHEIVLSLSPGPAMIEKAFHLREHATMWRITGDFWDNWPQLRDMFDRCELWERHVQTGHYPDCDMLTLGTVGRGFPGGAHPVHFTRDEVLTMLSLWCIFRSPMMLGCDLMLLDEDTRSMISNDAVLSLLDEGRASRQIEKNNSRAVWYSEGQNDRTVGLFNLEDKEQVISFPLGRVGMADDAVLTELWTGKQLTAENGCISICLPAHGCALVRSM